jgi:hypothetical protein
MEEIKELKKKEVKQVIEATQIATSTATAYKLPDGQVVNLEEYLIFLGNQILEIKRAIA